MKNFNFKEGTAGDLKPGDIIHRWVDGPADSFHLVISSHLLDSQKRVSTLYMRETNAYSYHITDTFWFLNLETA